MAEVTWTLQVVTEALIIGQEEMGEQLIGGSYGQGRHHEREFSEVRAKLLGIRAGWTRRTHGHQAQAAVSLEGEAPETPETSEGACR